MKILHITDLHFNKIYFDWINKQQNKFDIFCISGDFLESSKDETLAEQIKWVTNWMKEFSNPLFVCSGNHDIEDYDNEDWLEKLAIRNVYSDNCTKTINGIKFASYPYIGAEGYHEVDDCDVLITHVPPTGSKTSTDKNGIEWGDRELSRAIRNNIIGARIILCGHNHHPIKTIEKINNTTIYNPGVNKNNKIPNHHIIDL